MDDMALARPISFAAEPTKPEAEKVTDRELLAKFATAQFSRYITTAKIFLYSTGDDPGSVCEIKGYLSLSSGLGTTRQNIDTEEPVNHNWKSDNGGFGTQLTRDPGVIRRSLGLPANITAYLYEEGNWIQGNRIMLNYRIDWETADPAWANGNAWWIKSWNTSDRNYVCYLWWKVTTY
jgi:hypothetical protein